MQQQQTSSANRTIEELEMISLRMSRDIITMTTKAGSGHPSSSLSAIDVLTVLFFDDVLRYDPKRPDWPDRDRFIMSKGHASPAVYALLAEAGYIDRGMLATLREFGSPLEGHPVKGRAPGVEASTGSLGQGLSIGLGHALAARIDKRNFRVYVMIGDGESDEGQIWEAAMGAAKYEVDNLTTILDYNSYQQTGPMDVVMPAMRPIAEKWRAFGWAVFEIDGHNIGQAQDVFRQVHEVQGRPQIIIARTDKGKGLSPFVKDAEVRKHGVALTKQEAQVALQELDEQFRKQTGHAPGR